MLERYCTTRKLGMTYNEAESSGGPTVVLVTNALHTLENWGHIDLSSTYYCVLWVESYGTEI